MERDRKRRGEWEVCWGTGWTEHLGKEKKKEKEKHPAQVIIRPWEKETFDASNYFLLLLESSQEVPLLHFGVLPHFRLFCCNFCFSLLVFYHFFLPRVMLEEERFTCDASASRPMPQSTRHSFDIRLGKGGMEQTRAVFYGRETQFSFLLFRKREFLK